MLRAVHPRYIMEKVNVSVIKYRLLSKIQIYLGKNNTRATTFKYIYMGAFSLNCAKQLLLC